MTQAPGIGVTSLLFCSFQDLKEKKEVVEETENGRDAPANGNAVSMATICRERQPLCQRLLIFLSLLAFAAILSPALLRGNPSKWQHCAVQRAFKAPGSTDAPKPVGSSCVCRKEGLGLDPLPESRVRLCPVLPPP